MLIKTELKTSSDEKKMLKTQLSSLTSGRGAGRTHRSWTARAQKNKGGIVFTLKKPRKNRGLPDCAS